MAINNYPGGRTRARPHASPAFLSSDSFLDSWPLQLLFYAILATIPFFKFRQLGDLFFLKVDWLLTAALLALIVPVLLITKEAPSRLSSNIWPPLLLFFFVNVIASIASPYPGAAVAGIVVLSQVIAFAMINLVMLNERGIELLVPWVLALSIGINAALGLIGTIFGVDAFIEGGRALGGTITANNMALMSVYVFPITVYLVVYSHQIRARLLAALLLFLVVAGLVTSGSRGGFVNFVIVLLLLGWTFRKKFNVRYLGLVFAALALATAIVLASVPGDYWERQSSLGLLGSAVTESEGSLREDSSLERRAAYLVVVADAFVARPILGFGTNTFQELWFLSEESDAFDKERRPAHNTYAEVLVGSGLVGLAFFLGLLFVVYRNYAKAERLLMSSGDRAAATLVAMYRIAFVSVLFYFVVKSGLDHKLFILAAALSTAVLRYAEQRIVRDSSEKLLADEH